MSLATDNAAYLQRPFRVTHLIWAVLCLAACGVLIFAGGEGHPPAIILLPVVLAVWAVGHGGLWIVRRLAVRGRSRVGVVALSWPPGLIVAAIGTGFTSAFGVLLLFATLFQWKAERLLTPLWLTMAAIWVAHGACFAGLLLRRTWSRLFVALLCLGWAALLVVQIVENWVHGSPIKAPELALMVVLISIGALFGWHLARSQRIKAFLAGPRA
jgi:hypothetical protein